MNKVLVVGDIYIETQYFVDQIPSAKEFTFSSQAVTTTGSKTINASRVLAKLNNDVHFFGRVGKDSLGELAISHLQSFGVNTESVKSQEDQRTGLISVITDQNAESGIILFSGANKSIVKNEIDLLQNEIDNYDFIYTATNLAPESLYTLIDIANTKQIPIFIDFPNQHKVIDLTRISAANFIMPNREETQLILDVTLNSIEDAKNAIKQLRAKLKNNILITLDKDGCLILERDRDEPTHFRTEVTEAVDATASGDIFRAVFASTIIQTKDIDTSIRRALKAATESTKIKGVDNTLSSLDF